jgi:PAS domain S-box-containing protein
MEDKIKAGTKLKVLILEDSQADAELILELLTDSGYVLEYKLTKTEKEFESQLFPPKYDIILSDFSLPGFNAFGALNLCNQICPDIPFICVSGSIGEETAIELLKTGADDYILKDRLERLPFAVNRALDDAKEKLAHKQAEEDLKNSEKNYIILANSGQALIWTSGKDKQCNYFNDVWLKFTGRTLEQELGTGWTEGVHPDDLQFCLNTYIEAFERREKFSMEYRVKRHDGVYRWLQDDGSPRYNIKGDFAGYIGHCLDITDRKLAEEKLIESEQRFRELFENSLMGISEADLSGNLININMAYANMYGYDSPKEMMKEIKNVGRLYAYPEKRQEVLKILNQTGYLEPIEVELLKRDGSHFFVLVSAKGIMDAKGTLIGYQASHIEITQRKKAEEEILMNTQRVETLLELNQMTKAGLNEITDFALEEAIRFTKSTIGYVAFLNEDESVLTMHSWSKTAMAECAISDAPRDYPVVKTGLWGEAVRQRKPIITNDYAADNPFKKGMPEGHVHLSRHLNIPIFAGSKIVLVIGVGNKETDYNQDDVRQLTLLMDGMWNLLERKTNEEQIQKISEHYQAIIEKAPDGIVLIDAKGDFKYVSPSARKMFGYNPTEEISGSPARFMHPEDVNFVLSNLEQIFKSTDFSPTLQYRFLDNNEKWIWVESTFTNLFADSNVQAIVINFRNITERKNAEDALKEKAEQLQRFNDLMVGRE